MNRIPQLRNNKVILASQSPRRQYLLKEIGITYQLAPNREVDESYPDELDTNDIAEYLAVKKAQAFNDLVDANTILITADTIVLKDGNVLGKPIDLYEAKQFLRKLSASKHHVITGVCLTSVEKQIKFSSISEVCFAKLSNEEIDYYVSKFNPVDKAGAYGIQEWIGYIGIEKINGSFYNVMGLPTHKLYRSLLNFVEH